MEKKSLPIYIQPFRQANQGMRLQGKLLLSEFPRLADMLHSKEGEVAIDLQLNIDNEYLPYLKGTLNTCLSLTCQRCMKALPCPLVLDISLSPIFDEVKAKTLPPHYEPLLLTEDQILLRDIIEEELLLALPSVPKHEDEGCNCRVD